MKVTFESDQNIIKLDGVMVSLHCHHYNCGLVKALEEMEEVNVANGNHHFSSCSSVAEYQKN